MTVEDGAKTTEMIEAAIRFACTWTNGCEVGEFRFFDMTATNYLGT